MKTAVIDTSIEIQQSPAVIYRYLSQPQNLVGLQPFVIRVQQIQPLVAGTQGFDYQAIEIVRVLGLIPLEVRIQSRMMLTQPDRVLEQRAIASMGVHVRQTLTLNSIAPTITQVNNHVEVDAPAWLLGYSRKQAETAHQQFVRNLKDRVEAV